MATVNSRYDILKETDIVEELKLFKVNDINDEKIKNLYVIENSIFNENLEESLVNEFNYLKSFNFNGIINVEEIIFIENKDGIKFDNTKLGYITEYLDEYQELTEIVKQLSFRERIKIFGKICMIINTLYIQGYKVPKLSLNDIFIDNKTEENEIKVKIRDIVSFQLIKILEESESIKLIKRTTDLNLSLLGDVFYDIFKREITNDGLRSEEMKSLYSKLISKKGVQVFNNISDCIKYINNMFGLSIKDFEYDALNRISDSSMIIGKSYELNKIIEEVDNVYNRKEKNKIIAIKGEYGCGKSYVLNNIINIIENKYNNKSTIINLNSIVKENWKENLKTIIRGTATEDVVEKYNEQLIDIVSGIDNFNCVISKSDMKFAVLNKIIKLFTEMSENKMIVLTCDKLDLDDSSMEMFIKYIITILKKSDNIVLIFTMSNNIIEKTFNKKDLNDVSVYNLEYLNEYETAKLISSSLKTSEAMYEFSSNVYRETLGNPQYIKHMLSKLYEYKKLYVDKKTGNWVCEEYISKIGIPTDLEESLIKQLEVVSLEELEILQELSIFNTPLQKKIFEDNILLNRNKQFENLKNLKFIVEKFDDNGLLIDYRNYLLKKVVYNSLNEDIRISKHKTAIKLLESNFVDTKQILEELICQYEALEDKDRCSELCKKYAKSMFKHSKEKAIIFYKKALKYVSNNEKESLMLYFQIGKLYEYLGKNENAYEYYMHVRESKNKENNKEMAEVLLRMANISLWQYGALHAENLKYEAKEILGIDEKVKNNLWYKYIEARILFEKSEYDNSLEIVNDILSIINVEEKELYAFTLSLKGIIKIKQTEYSEAKTIINEAKYIFNNICNIEGKIICNMYLGELKITENNEFDEALKIYKNVSEVIKIHNIQEYGIYSNIKMSTIYMLNGMLEEGKELCLGLLDDLKNNNYLYFKSIVYFNLCYYYTEIGELYLAYEYLKMGLNIMNKLDDYIKYDFYSIYFISNYYAKINRYDEAIRLLQLREEELILYDNSINRVILSKYYYYCIANTNNISEIKSILLKLRDPLSRIKDDKFKSIISYDIIIHLNEIGYEDIARKMFQGCYKSYEDNEIEIKNIYLKMLFEDNDKEFLENDIIKIIEEIEDKLFTSKVYYLLGNIRCKKEDFIVAINYYYNSISNIAINLDMLHDEEKLLYFNKSRFLSAYNKLCDILLKEFKVNIKKWNLCDINSIKEMDLLIENIKVENLMNDEKIVTVLKSQYKDNNANLYSDIYNIFNDFTNNIISNIETIIKFILKETLADEAILFINDSKEKYKEIYSLNNDNATAVKEMLGKIKYDSNIIIVKETLRKDLLINSSKLLPKGIKNAMVLNISMQNEDSIGEKVNGTLVIMSKNALSNITNKVKSRLNNIIPFIDFLMVQHKLEEVSTLDKLTGVYNRKYLDDIYPAFINRARENGKIFSSIIFDIDNFKGVNDSFGHQAGDEVLIKVATIVKENINSQDVFARYGGEEFVVLMSDISSKEALKRANIIRECVQDARVLGDRRDLTISMGISEYPMDSNNANGLIKKADQALYVAKETGRNRCVVWDNKFSKKNNANDKLAGIISGNSTKDYRKISLMMDVVSLIKQNISFEEKVEKLLSIVMEISEAEQVSIHIINDGKISNTYSKKQFIDRWIDEKNFNYELIDEAINKAEGLFLVDWKYSYRLEENELLPDWKSVCVIPIINNGVVKACMYLSVSINTKEFSFDEYNYITAICEIATAMF